jgi:alpha-D-xyloside xylohydrolase
MERNAGLKKSWLTIVVMVITGILSGVQGVSGLSVTSYTKDTDGITCVCNTGVMKVQICKADIVRVAYTTKSAIPARLIPVVNKKWDKPTFTDSETDGMITLQTGKLKVKINKANANITYTTAGDEVILAEYNKSMAAATVEGVSTNTITAEFNSPASEALYGLGQHEKGVVNYKGQVQVLDQDYGSHATATPILISSNGYGIFWDNYAKTTFSGNIASNTRYSLVSECGDLIDYYFFYGPEIDDVIANYRTATGSVPMFPKWAYGLIQSKDKYQSQKEVLAVKDGYRNNKIPLDCIVQDWHYWDGVGKQGCYCFNTGYTDVKGMLTTLKNANLHTTISIWSEVEQGSTMYTTLDNMGALWPSAGTTRFIDAYHTEARETFWKAIYGAFFNPAVQGWDGWWLDNDEPFPYPDNFNRRTLTTAMGKGVLFYNTYTFMMTEMGYNNWRRDVTDKRCFILHRACFAGQQRHSAVNWNNDINCTWDAYKNSVPSGLNSTITGIPYWCTDIGGYWGVNADFTTASNRELMTRWFQYGAFLPVFRIHGNMKAGQGKELYSSTWDATTKENLLSMDKLRYRLMPYIYSLAWMTTNQSYTPMRHLIMDYRSDEKVRNIGNQFMYGPAFMVSPVTTEGATSRSVYLPDGKWYDFWTGATVNGGASINAAAPLSQIPLHIKAGSVIPMGPDIQYANERSDTIELRIYPGADGSFSIYEDEGDSYNYENGKYSTIPIMYLDESQKVIIGARNGSFTGMDSKKVFNIVYVKNGHGVGIGKTEKPDVQLVYTGTQTSTDMLGVVAGNGKTHFEQMKFTTGTIQNCVSLPGALHGKTVDVRVFNSSGRLVGNAVVNGQQSINLRKQFGLSDGFYIVKAVTLK